MNRWFCCSRGLLISYDSMTKGQISRAGISLRRWNCGWFAKVVCYSWLDLYGFDVVSFLMFLVVEVDFSIPVPAMPVLTPHHHAPSQSCIRKALTGSLAKLSPETWCGFVRNPFNIYGTIRACHSRRINMRDMRAWYRFGVRWREICVDLVWPTNVFHIPRHFVTKLARSRSLPQFCRLVMPHQDNESTGAFDVWEFLNMKKSTKRQRFLFLTSDAASLQVTPVYRYTSTLNSFWIILGKLVCWPFDAWIMVNHNELWISANHGDMWNFFVSALDLRDRMSCRWSFATEECWVLLPTCSRIWLQQAATATTSFSDQIFPNTFGHHTSSENAQHLCKIGQDLMWTCPACWAKTCHCHWISPL